MVTMPKKNAMKEAVELMAINYIITGLIHDLGKLPSAHDKDYVSGSHPWLFELPVKKHCPH